VNVSIVNESPGTFVRGSNSSFVYLIGSDLKLTCSTTSTPAANSVFRWDSSTGFFAGEVLGQTISVTIQKSGIHMIVCTYIVDGREYNSDPIEIRVTGKSGDHCNYTATNA